MELKPFYWNFDGLDVTFQGRIPQALVDTLGQAKLQAQKVKGSVLVEWQGEPLHVAESGAKGGYAFRCDTGPVGATWFFSSNQNAANWNIRVSVKSNALASLKLGGVRRELYRFLEAIGADVGQESLSRIDYCMDFLSDDIARVMGLPFVLDPTAFVMHSRTSRADQDDDAGIRMQGVSGFYTSVTCGKMPGRQVIAYDKSREVRAKGKSEWWAHWNAARETQGLPDLAPDVKIWRMELRAGKKHLKDRWGITRWADLDDKLGDLLRYCLDDIRYTIPNPTDRERNRWPNHPLWNAAIQTVTKDLHEMQTGAEPGIVKDIMQAQLVDVMEAQIKGLVATWTVATGSSVDARTISSRIAHIVHDHIEHDAGHFEKALRRSAEKYRFLEG
ncbi:hypothetical protein [Hwanghaeella sp. 1Z406]|uniref:hypothetical protein n=1 Tax=Hwanghaeella sp. 1Z406 TaxID=3402811 RepID=UPI003B685AF0